VTKEIEIFVRVLQTPPAKQGLAIVLYRYKGRVKELYFSTLERTPNRSVILASTIAIEGLNGACNINLYTQSNFGFLFMMKKVNKKWVNRDVGNVLIETIAKGGHEVNLIDCSATDEGKDYQQALAAKLKKFKT
jgi:ribonuclease HI